MIKALFIDQNILKNRNSMHLTKSSSKKKASTSLHQPKKDLSVQKLKVRDQNIQNDNQKLCQQYYQLREKLFSIVEQIDSVNFELATKKQKNKSTQQDPRILQIKQQLKQQELTMIRKKNKIMKIKKTLQNQHNLQGLNSKTNELKYLQKQVQKLKQDKKALIKIKKRQHKELYGDAEAIASLKKVEAYEQQIKQITVKNKKTMETANIKERAVRKLHEAYIIKQKKLQDITTKIHVYKSQDKDNQINEQNIEQLVAEIEALQQQRKKSEKQKGQELKLLEKQKNQYKQQEKRLKRMIQTKYQQLRHAEMKHKETIRLVRSFRIPKSFDATKINQQVEQLNNKQNQPYHQNQAYQKQRQQQFTVSNKQQNKQNKQQEKHQVLRKNAETQNTNEEQIIQENQQNQIIIKSKLKQQQVKILQKDDAEQYVDDFDF